MTFRGLTWDHPRGYNALAEAARRVSVGRSEPLIIWDRQPLEGFESAPIDDLASRYDVIVLDHPHIGEAVAKLCLQPLEPLYGAEQIRSWANQSVGSSVASYQWDGKTWALPLDVATQVMARRAERVAKAPQTWPEIVRLAETQPVAQSLAGPHALLTLFSTIAGLGGNVGGADLVSNSEAERALSIMHRLYRARPPASETLNPIALYDAMIRGDVALVPLIFGYVNYARSGLLGQIRFSGSIGLDGPHSGGVLGGTGIALSQRCEVTQPLLDHIADLLSSQAQRTLFPEFDGQPSSRAAWLDEAVNTKWGEFYKGCLSTAENALVRPRFDGYVHFQNWGSQRLRDALQTGEAEENTLAALRAQWARVRSPEPARID